MGVQCERCGLQDMATNPCVICKGEIDHVPLPRAPISLVRSVLDAHVSEITPSFVSNMLKEARI